MATTARKTPTPVHRRALLGALADPKGRVQETNTRVLNAIYLSRWVTEVTNDGRTAASARLFGYVGGFFLVINSRGRRALLTDAEHTALRAAGPDGRLPADTSWRTKKTLRRDGLIEFRNAEGIVHPSGDEPVPGPQYAPYATELGRRAVTGFPQSQRAVKNAPALTSARRAAEEGACTCVINCDEAEGGCSLAGQRHVHPRTRTGQYGPCPEHPEAPGDL